MSDVVREQRSTQALSAISDNLEEGETHFLENLNRAARPVVAGEASLYKAAHMLSRLAQEVCQGSV